MWLIIIALLAGCIVGASGRIPAHWSKPLNRITSVVLFVMLAALGAQIGSNGQLVANLTTLGGKAAVITLFCVVGSIAFLWFTSHWMEVKGEERHRRQEGSGG